MDEIGRKEREEFMKVSEDDAVSLLGVEWSDLRQYLTFLNFIKWQSQEFSGVKGRKRGLLAAEKGATCSV